MKKCHHCGPSQLIKAGKLKHKCLSRQGYRCNDRMRFFVERDGFGGRHYLKEIKVMIFPQRNVNFDEADAVNFEVNTRTQKI